MTLFVEGIRKRLGGRAVLDDVGLSGATGEIIALFGENGAGKSTLLRILAGILDADAGNATLAGLSILGPTARARALVGYVPEAADAPPHLSPRELAALVAALKKTKPLPDALRDRLGISDYFDKPIGSLSLGQRRRSCLAAALVGDVKLLLLDEPTNGLDPSGVRDLAAILAERRAEGTTTLVATHDHAFAEALDATAIHLSGGRMRQGHPGGSLTSHSGS